MKTQVIVTITHPDEVNADWVALDVIHPFINDVNSDSNDDWSFTVTSSETETELRDKALGTALSLALSDYPSDLSNGELLNLIADPKDDSIIVWQTFEYWDREDIISHIEDTAEAIYTTYFK